MFAPVEPNKLDELRAILLRPNHEKLESLRARVEEAGPRAADIAEVLPESVAASFGRDSRLVAALRKPLRQCVAESVREDPEDYANALFPIMGPAIRRSVAEAFKAWIQQANQAIEQSLSPRGLGWRFEAWRAGIPFGQYVLQRTLLYRVEQVYLIHAASGLLIGHVQQGDRLNKDEDAVSAMFTAIQEFVKDSFISGGEPQRLRTAELGELNLWAVHGPTAVLVAVIRGVPPTSLRADLEAALEQLETHHGPALKRYNGDRDELADLEPALRACLQVSLRDATAAQATKRFSPAVAILALFAMVAVGGLGYGFWMQNRVARVADALDSTSGIVVTRIDRSGRTLIVHGLRDPLAPTAQAIAAAAGWTGGVDADLEPYVSLDQQLVQARAQSALQAPATVSMDLRAGTLILAGSAPAAWIAALQATPVSIPGVDRIDADSLVPDNDSLIALLRARLNPPDGVELTMDGDVLSITGTAPKRWLDMTLSMVSLPGVSSIDHSQLALAEMLGLQAIARRTNGVSMSFDSGAAALAAAQRDNVAAIADDLARYGALAAELGLEPRLTIMGHSDQSGTDALNIVVEKQRADAFATALREAGIEPSWLSARSQLEDGGGGLRVPQISLRLQALPPADTPDRD